jgi:SAM-dependent methyltransferase
VGIEGVVDRVTSELVDGWAYRDDDHVEHLLVAVELRGVRIGSNLANQFREDLRDADIGNGDHAYLIYLDRPLGDGDIREVVVVASSRDGQSLQLALPALPAAISNEANESSQAMDNLAEDIEDATQALIQGRLGKKLAYAMAYAEADELLPPVGYPADFIDDRILAESSSWVRASPEELKDRIRKDLSLIPHPYNREGYADGDDLVYWLSGYHDYRTIQGIAAGYGITGGRYFDFGGSTGRVFRHFAFQADAWDVWSSDFKISSVEFNLKYFPSKVRVFLNSSLPSLPLPDAYFDLISAFSVFTHIDETETGWLLELRRLLKVGGVACVSIHNEDTWSQMPEPLRNDVVQFRPEIADRPTLPEGKTVVTFRDDDPYRCQTFHSADYIKRNWGRFFEICEIRPLVVGQQALVICRRPD